MRVTVNDRQLELADGSTVVDLLRELDLAGAIVAVERNREIVPRARHAGTALAEGDRLEIVTLVGGG